MCVCVCRDGSVGVHRLAPDRLLRVAEGLEVVAGKQVEAGPAVPQPYVPPQRRQLRTREKLLRILRDPPRASSTSQHQEQVRAHEMHNGYVNFQGPDPHRDQIINLKPSIGDWQTIVWSIVARSYDCCSFILIPVLSLN